MENKNKKPLIFMSLLVIVFIAIGVTLAYFTTTDTFNNEFYASEYDVETQESFVSPDNWKPGDTTPKTVIATNHGDIPIAVRVKLTPRWEDKNGDPLPLTDNNDNEVAVIDFSKNYDRKWVYQDGYYYYNKPLEGNQSTTSLLKSVTFNMDAEIDNNTECETVDGVTTCRTIFSDYSGGKYTLQVEIETAQYDNYKEIWGTDVNLKALVPRDKVLMVNTYNYSNPTTFGKSINRNSFEKIVTLDDIEIPNNAIDSWDCSDTQNESVMCWYTDDDSDDKYELYIGQEGGVIANPNSEDAFANFYYVENVDLENLNTSIVTNMKKMFYRLGYENSTFEITGLENIDTSNVENMNYTLGGLFYNNQTVELDLSNWDTSNVTDMSYMLSENGNRSQSFRLLGLNNWDVSKVTNMSGTFQKIGQSATTWSIGDLSDWDTQKVTTMAYMFNYAGENATTWSIGDLSDWDTSSVTSMNYMFSIAGRYAPTFNLGNLDNWDTSNVTYMTSMFSLAGYNATTWNIGDLSEWNVSKVQSTAYMFSSTGRNATTWNIGDLSEWDISSVTSMGNMFSGAGYSATTWDIGDLSGWDTSNVYGTSNMFEEAGYSSTKFDLGDLSNWDTSHFSNINMMFNKAGYSATTWNIGDLSGWDTTNVTTMISTFNSAGYNATTFNLDLSGWNVSKVKNMSGMFANSGYNATTWSIGDLSNWVPNKVVDMSSMFQYAGYNATTWNSLGTFTIYPLTDEISDIFYGCQNATLTLYLKDAPKTYRNALFGASTVSGSGILVNYGNFASSSVDKIIATKSPTSNVVKGSLIS